MRLSPEMLYYRRKRIDFILQNRDNGRKNKGAGAMNKHVIAPDTAVTKKFRYPFACIA